MGPPQIIRLDRTLQKSNPHTSGLVPCESCSASDPAGSDLIVIVLSVWTCSRTPGSRGSHAAPTTLQLLQSLNANTGCSTTYSNDPSCLAWPLVVDFPLTRNGPSKDYP